MYNDSFTNLTLLCDEKGKIIECLNDGYGLSGQFPAGKQFLSCFNSENFTKVLELTVQIKSGQYLPCCNIKLIDNKNDKALCFSGKMLDDKLLIVASENKEYTSSILKTEFGNPSEAETNISASDGAFQTDTRVNFNYITDELTRLNNEIVKYKEEISRKNVELNELNKIKNQFLGMAAHDLRNPLANIMSYCEFILDDKETLNNDQIEYVNNIHTLSRFMVHLVNDLLDISNIESGNLKLNYNRVDLIEVVTNNIKFTKLLAEKKNIKIILNSEPERLEIEIDPQKIDQVLTNLLSNAVKFSFPDTKIVIGISQVDNFAIVSVKDEGQGIPHRELPNLFTPFHKSSVKATDGERSTGLGLVIVRKIIEAHKGNIEIESESGRGSTFTFTLPMTDQLSIF